MKRIISIALIVTLVLVGCTSKTSNPVDSGDYNPFEQSSVQNGENIDAIFGYGLVEPADDMKLKYSADMSLDFWIDNAGSRNDFGFMVFVDGIRQDISIDGGERENMHIFDIAAGEKKNFTVSFEPTAAHTADTLGICFGVMIDPEYTPDSPAAVFGNRYSINALDLTLTDVPEDIAITDCFTEISGRAVPPEVQQRFCQYDESGNITGNRLGESVQLLAKKVGEGADGSAPNAVSASDKLEIQLLGGSEKDWRVSVYTDHRLVPVFGEKCYADMPAGVNTMSAFTVDMSQLAPPSGDFGTVYFIAVPTDGGRLVKSHTMVFCGEENVQ